MHFSPLIPLLLINCVCATWYPALPTFGKRPFGWPESDPFILDGRAGSRINHVRKRFDENRQMKRIGGSAYDKYNYDSW